MVQSIWPVCPQSGCADQSMGLPPIPPQAVFVGNGLVAILAGLIANYLVSNMGLGPVAPFDAAIVALLIGGVVIYLSWGENYGDSRHTHTLQQQLQMAAASILAGERGGAASPGGADGGGTSVLAALLRINWCG